MKVKELTYEDLLSKGFVPMKRTTSRNKTVTEAIPEGHFLHGFAYRQIIKQSQENDVYVQETEDRTELHVKRPVLNEQEHTYVFLATPRIKKDEAHAS